MLPYEIEGSVRLMNRLIDKGHDVTLLTNWAADTFTEARGRFPFLENPRGVTVSGEIKLIKPDPRNYQHHASPFGLDPSATLFTDDNPTNGDAAKAAGWEAILCTNPAALEEALAKSGITP